MVVLTTMMGASDPNSSLNVVESQKVRIISSGIAPGNGMDELGHKLVPITG